MSTNEKCTDNGEPSKKTYKYTFEFDGLYNTLGRVGFDSSAKLTKLSNQVRKWSVEDDGCHDLGTPTYHGWLLKNCGISILEDGESIDIGNAERRNLGEYFPDNQDGVGKLFFYYYAEVESYDYSFELNEPFDPAKLVIGYHWYVDAEGDFHEMTDLASIWYDGKNLISGDNEIDWNPATKWYCGAWVLEGGVRTRIYDSCEDDDYMDEGDEEDDERSTVSASEFFREDDEAEEDDDETEGLEIVGPNKYTCLNGEEEKVDGAIVGAKEDVLAWMKETFPGIRKSTEREMMSAWEFFYEGEIEAYETVNGENVYLAEVVSRE